MMATMEKMKALCKKYHFEPKRKYGQNFLINPKTASNIVSLAPIDQETVVIEIGSGLGALSELILSKAKRLICYEIDEDLCKILKAELGGNPQLSVIHQDFLKVTDEEMTSLCQNYKVIFISNLPYYITSEIIAKILTLNLKVDCFIAMMQKEVAERITSDKGGKDFNELTIFANYFAEVEYALDVMKSDFYPHPNIDSAVLRFKNFTYVDSNRDFITIIRGLFTQRRKTIYNNLVALLQDKQVVTDGLVKLGLNPLLRAESLQLKQIDEICRYFKPYLPSK